MKTAQFHRAYWDYDSNTGAGKIHYKPLGVIAFIFENGCPKLDVNFLDKDEVSYYRQQYKKQGVTWRLGVQIDRDVDLVRVTESENIFTFEELNLEVKTEDAVRSFRQLNGEWIVIENAHFVEYQRCDSLLLVK
ncbi:MAG: hypothetical protein KME21_30720 [Desmonostoc vinosum HA7617-LM4]|jgi:hypothetical protein|nr:hypothetical protein [Desmonostoc vinosum HA7617-LM4]